MAAGLVGESMAAGLVGGLWVDLVGVAWCLPLEGVLYAMAISCDGFLLIVSLMISTPA